jgi:TetR/AcrR family acrAB operon transcriptional repressor
MARKRKEDAQRTRTRILASALSLFAKKGYDHTTFTDIAARLKMTKGAVYWHFESKEALLIALVDEMLEKFSRQTEAIMPKDELTFRAVADMMVENARLVVDDARGRAFFMLMRTQIRWGEESMHGVREELLTNQRFGPWHAFIRAVENDKAAGRARAGVDAMEVANMCVSVWDGMVQGRIDGFLRTDMCLTIRHAFDAVWNHIKV